MESPVRICLGAALVVNLLLLCNAPAEALALPNDITPTTVKDDRTSRFKANATWPNRSKPKTPDVALNELTPKESTSEEHTEKNAKYKDRGRVKFGSRVRTSTSSPKRNRVTSSTETATLVIVTPTPEVKKPAQIIDSMRNYKRTKMPVLSSTTPVSVKSASNEKDEEDDSFEKFTSDKYHDNFFTIPSFDNDHDFGHNSDDSSNSRVKNDSRGPSYNFPDYSKEDSYNFKDTEPFKSSFFNFDSELTTPKNDFFDKKYHKISSSIIKKLDTIKAKSLPPNATNVPKIVKENIGLERLSNNTPSNKSSVFIKNTKEIRLSDNDGASSVNKELSDMHGTSIYYEMSVLSTETYTMNHSNEDDCDDASPPEATASTSPEDETKSLEATQSTTEAESKKSAAIDPKSETLSQLSTNFLPVTSIVPFFSTMYTIPYSTQSSISPTERVTKLFSNYRNRSYSKRLNLTGSKDSPNSVTPKTEGTLTVRPQTRKFHYTTPRTKPVWMSPRRNITRVYVKPTSPKTIYSEHFSIKDKFSTTKPMQPSKSILTTISSAEIDPVLQTDVSGTSKTVYSQIANDNTIPSLRKRGSMKFKASTASSAEVEADMADLEMPSTAWALASLISPPSLPSSVVNATENELQKVGEVIDKKESTMDLTTTSTVSSISNDIITKKVTEVNQNKLPAFKPTSPSNENKINTEIRERLPAESNISLQSSAELATTESVKDNTLDAHIKSKEVKPLWLPPTVEPATTTDKNEISNETIPPVDASRSTGFESITKLPADVTTPQDEAVASSEVNQTVSVEKSKITTDYEITTIRFGYVPTETTEDTTDPNTIATTTERVWHSAMPTRTKATTVEDSPITTYRPIYLSTTEIEETTTIVPDTTPVLEVSSQVIANVTEHTSVATESTIHTTEITTEPVEVTTETMKTTETLKTTEVAPSTSVPITTEKETTETPTVPTTEKTQEDTTTIVFEVVTEINTEKSTLVTLQTTETMTSSEDTYSTSEENSHSNEINYEIKTEEPSIKPETDSPTTTTNVESTDAEKIEDTRAKVDQTTPMIETDETTTEIETDVTKAVSELEDLTTYGGEMTTESSPRGPEEAGSGAAIAIVVSTIGVIALVLLIGLLLVVRRRGRRGVYAQRCTPVSLDAYSLDSVSVGHRKGNQRLRASKRSYGNPAYDDEVTSHPMQYPALASFALDVESMTAEFAEIPSVTVRGEEVPPGCEDKNRYSNVLPLPETRVPLKKINNDPTTEYINASYVTGPGHIRNYYILAQAPLSNTVVDFWRMVWEQNSRLVVMLTEYMENGVEKCYEYLPPSEISDNKRTFGEFKIILKKRDQRDKYAVSTIQLINMTTRTWREITHLWYFWPAKGVPEDYDSVIDFLFEMRSYMKVAQTAKEYDEEGVEVIYGDQNRSSFNNLSKLREENGSNGVNVYSPAKAEEQMRRANNGTLSRMKAASEVEGIRPCVVTCASGAGRSAALAALDVTSRALAGGAADVPRAVRALRTMRPHALSNRHHYMWLYKVLSEYGNKIMGSGDTI